MLQLPNNCRAGNFSVHPANWKSPSAKWNNPWRISYWFFDDNLNKKVKVVIKGMNRLRSLKEKQELTQKLKDHELDLILVEGYNPVTKNCSVIVQPEISGTTPVIDALQHAFTKLRIERPSDIKSCLKYVFAAINDLRLQKTAIRDIKRRHIKAILERCGEDKKRWSASSYNHYRSYLSMLFRELVEMEAIEANPVRDISRQKQVRLFRLELDKEKERPIVRAHLSKHYPLFWRFVNIFFHSGSRITELLRLKPADVDIPGQRFKVLVKKGGGHREQWRPIKDVVLQDWKEALATAGETDYIFSKGLQPGATSIGSIQVTKRWRVHVKKKLGIKADLYSLKHSNLDEMAEALQKHHDTMDKVKDAAGHSGKVVTMIYTQGEVNRQDKTVRTIANEF